MTDALEAANQAGKKRLDVDAERFVDLANMLQRRKDDESKRRPVKREEEIVKEIGTKSCKVPMNDSQIPFYLSTLVLAIRQRMGGI